MSLTVSCKILTAQVFHGPLPSDGSAVSWCLDASSASDVCCHTRILHLVRLMSICHERWVSCRLAMGDRLVAAIKLSHRYLTTARKYCDMALEVRKPFATPCGSHRCLQLRPQYG